jgi:hypothetical protein
MNSIAPKICFYIPSQDLINNPPMKIQENWVGINEYFERNPVISETGELYDIGPSIWVVLTFMQLREYGYPCELTATLPHSGIIITHSDFLSTSLRPTPQQFIVEFKPDRSLRCIYSNFVIVQNKHDPICRGINRLFIKSAFIKYWPQPGLIPRDPQREDRFENICFMGDEFIQDVETLESEIQKLGLKWMLMHQRNKWHDYSKVDAIVAVRPVDPHRTPYFTYISKPASKLYNAWIAGVPAILSPDSAFEDLRESEFDYLKAENVPEIIEGLKQLMNDPALRKSMIENGKKRAKEFNSEVIIEDWVKLIQNRIVPAYNVWSSSQYHRYLFFFSRTLAYGISGIIQKKVRRLRNKGANIFPFLL